MPTRYIHGLAVCYACDTSYIGSCAICATGVCNQHIAPNTLGVFLCSECKSAMVAMSTQELVQKILTLIVSRRSEMATETQTIGMLDALVDDVVKLCQAEIKGK